MRLVSALVGACALVFVLSVTSIAQTTTGSIFGDVTDASGARLPGAVVLISADDTGLTRETATNAEGAYRVGALPPGVYSVSVDLANFQPVTRASLELNVRNELKVDFQLEIGPVTQSITVTAAAPLTQTANHSFETLVSNDLVAELPTKGREYLDLALLTPGTMLDQSSARNPVGTDSISFFGFDESHKAIYVEGVDFNDEVIGGGTNISGGTRTPIGQDAIQEFQVMASGYSPEFGRTGTGVVNLVVKSGSNDLHGSAFYFLQHDAFDKPSFSIVNGVPNQDGDVPPFRNDQYGGTVGGPFANDRAFYFFSLERRTLDADAQITIPDDVRAFVDGLNRGYDTSSIVPRERKQFNGVAKLTFNLGNRHRLDTVYIYDDDNDLNKDIGGSEAADRGFDDLNSSYYATASLTSTIGAGTVNEFRVNRSIQRIARSIRPDTEFLPALIFSSVNIGLDGSAAPQSRDQKNWIVANTTSHQFGNHTLKWGGDINVIDATNDTNEDFNGFYEMSPTFVPLRYQAGFNLQFARGESPDPSFTRVERDMNLYSVFGNDTWRVTPNFTLNLGLRYDLRVLRGDFDGPDAFEQPGFSRSNPEDVWLQVALGEDGALGVQPWRPVPTDTLDLSPRVGFAWDVNGDGTAVVRASYGIYHDRIPSLTLRDALNIYNGLNVQTISIENPDFFPNAPNASDLSREVSFTSVPSPHGDTPYVQQFTAGVQWAWERDTVFSADFTRLLGLNFLITRNVNAPLPLDQTGGQRVCPFGTELSARGYNPCFQMRLGHDQSNRIHANSLTFQMRRRTSERLSFILGYTLGAANEFNVGGFPIIIGVQPADAYNKFGDVNFGASENDVRHRFTGNVVYSFPYDINVAAIVTANSAPPYNQTLGVDANLDFKRDDRPAGVKPNSLRGEAFFNTDLRVSKRFFFDDVKNVEVLWEMFNLFNTANLVNFNGALNSGSYGQGRAALAPFRAQLGIRFAF